MRELVKGLAVGMFSGAVAWFACIMSVAYTSAVAMPEGFPLVLWDAVVVFGIGAALVSFVVHVAALRLFKARHLSSLFGFAVVVVACVAATGPLAFSLRFISATIIGALSAWLVAGLGSDSSFKPKSFRDAA